MTFRVRTCNVLMITTSLHFLCIVLFFNKLYIEPVQRTEIFLIFYIYLNDNIKI